MTSHRCDAALGRRLIHCMLVSLGVLQVAESSQNAPSHRIVTFLMCFCSSFTRASFNDVAADERMSVLPSSSDEGLFQRTLPAFAGNDWIKLQTKQSQYLVLQLR